MTYSPKTLAMLKALQPKFREAGCDESNVPFKMNGCGRCFLIPSVCDDSSEEARKRSLWGMVDWERFTVHSGENETVDIHEHYRGENHWHCWDKSLTDALLSALCEQWGVEVKG